MSDTQNTQDQAPAAPATEADATPFKFFATKGECEANKPADAPKGLRPFLMSKAGTEVGWIWAGGYDNALARTARNSGYTVSLGGKTAPVTKEAVAAKLTSFSDEELLALGLRRKKGKK